MKKFDTTADIKVPKNLVNTVIGQEEAVEIAKKAAKQRRNLLLIGQPGTGKSLVGQALADMLPNEKLVDVLSFPNPNDDNLPFVKALSKGDGIKLVEKAKASAESSTKMQSFLFFVLVIFAAVMPWWIREKYGDIMAAASMLSSIVFIAAFALFMNLGKRMRVNAKFPVPKILIDNSKNKKSPFLDGTGAQAGALLGDVLHDPLQSGGLGTPAYERLVPGLIHRSSGGVLFVDEVGNLQPHSQQELLTAMQEKKYPITGQSERSSGAMVRSDPVPTDFVLVAAGNLETVKNMHPALRSRIRGYGYEVYMEDKMEDNEENRDKLVQFIAQEVVKDGKIPHFDRTAVEEIIHQAQKMAGTSGKLTLRLRELGGLVRAAGDLAKEKGDKVVRKDHVVNAKNYARTLEKQMADRYIEQKKNYQVIRVKGLEVGRVNGLAVIGDENAFSGMVLPIESEVTIGGKKAEFIATGKLGDIAKEAVKNVSAIIMKYFGEDIKEKYDVYTQFIGTPEGVEGDSASIAVATSIISALKKVPVRQDTAMTGSLSVRGEVLAVGGVNAKAEAALEAGIKKVLVPRANFKDVLLNGREKDIKVVPVSNIKEVLRESLDWKGHEKILKKLEKS